MSKGHHCRSVHLFSLLSGWMIVCVCKSATSGTPQTIMGQSVQRSHGSFKNIWCQTMGFGVYSIRDNFILLFSSEELDVECVEKKQAQSCHTLVVILCDLSSRERGPAAVGGGGVKGFVGVQMGTGPFISIILFSLTFSPLTLLPFPAPALVFVFTHDNTPLFPPLWHGCLFS